MLRALKLAAVICLLDPSTGLAQDATAYERGVEARLSGDAAGAVPLLEQWLAENPDDVDARVQLGYAYLALGRLEDAERQFRTVVARTPEYTDASQGLAEIQRRRARGDKRQGFVLFEGAVSTLAGGLQDWRETGVVLSVPVAQRDTFDVRGVWYERFGFDDVEIGALYTHRAGDNTWLRMGASGTPSADFRPEIGLTAGVDHRLSEGPSATVIGFDAAWRSFPAQDVFNISPAITRYLGGTGDFSLTARANALVAEDDSLRIGGSFRGDFAPGDRSRAFLGIAAGPDTDVGLVIDTYSIFGGGEVPLGDTVSITGSFAREWRDGPADRTEFRIGLKVRL